VSIPFNVPGWAIGDSLALARQLPDESIDCIVTSPPYWGLRSYLADDDPSKALEMGAEPTLAEYVERLVVLFRELRRALKDGGTCWLNLGDSYSGGGMPNPSATSTLGGGKDRGAAGYSLSRLPPQSGLKPKDLCLVPYRVALALQADGWWLRDNIVWHKPNPMPASVTDRCTSAHEAVFLLTKSARYWFDAEAVKEPMVSDGCGGLYVADSAYRKASQTGGKAAEGRRTESEGRNKRNVWTIATRPYSGSHYAVMPPALVEPCIQAGCPHKVCVECGAPWERVTESSKVETFGGTPKTAGRKAQGLQSSKSTIGRTKAWKPGERTTTTLGWEPTCEHEAGTAQGLVLDPFGGSGTVGQVAESLGRKWLLFDLDARNEALMAQRTAQRSLLGMIR